jgi:hypothetical protein
VGRTEINDNLQRKSQPWTAERGEEGKEWLIAEIIEYFYQKGE